LFTAAGTKKGFIKKSDSIRENYTLEKVSIREGNPLIQAEKKIPGRETQGI
jgi:hypothetical protein